MYSRLSVLVAASMACSSAFADTDKIFESADKNCVAWRATKRMFLVSTLHPVGKSCDLKLTTSQTPEGAVIRLEFAAKSLKSGEEGRDDVVTDLLSNKEFPNVVVQTKPIATSSLAALKDRNLESLETHADLIVKGQSIGELSLKVNSNKTDTRLRGQVDTSFSSLSLKVSSVVGGVVAKVADNLELQFVFDSTTL